jgi:hypothetical protein
MVGKAPITVSSSAFRTQEWSNLVMDDVSLLRMAALSYSFFFVGLVGSGQTFIE